MSAIPPNALHGEDVGAVVIDLGRTTINAGFAGNEWPTHSSYSLVGVRRKNQAETGVALPDDPEPQPYKRVIPSELRTSTTFPVHFSAVKENLEIRSVFKNSATAAFSLDVTPETYLTTPIEPLELDEDAFIRVIDSIFHDKGCLSSTLAGLPVLLTEPNKHSETLRRRMSEILFETFKVEALSIARKGVLACFSLGKSSGLVIDIGAESMSLAPVHDGYTLQQSVVEVPVAGNVLDLCLLQYLRKLNLDSKLVPLYEAKRCTGCLPRSTGLVPSLVNHQNIHPSYAELSRREVLRNLKEAICYVQEEPPLAPPSASGSPTHPIIAPPLSRCHDGHYLPDGTLIPDTAALGGAVTEVLFNYDAIFSDRSFGLPSARNASVENTLGYAGLADAINKTILGCDVDARKDLLSALIFVGGSSLFPGFAARVSAELQNPTFTSASKHRVFCSGSAIERRFSTWIGGSILASLASFQQMWISKYEFNDFGFDILTRRCLL